MTDDPGPAHWRFGIHVYFNCLLGLLLACAFAFLGTGVFLIDRIEPRTAVLTALGVLIAFVGGLVVSLRKCSMPVLSGARGLLLIAAYMTTGVGGSSVLVAVPSVAVASYWAFAVGMIGLLDGDPSLAPQQFHRLIKFFAKHRVYQ